MANITLQTLITESADYVKADLDDDDSAVIESRLKSAINEAKNIIARRIRLTTSEYITLDDSSCFDAESLTQPFSALVSVKVNGGSVVAQEQGGLIQCNASPLTTVFVEYQYIPVDMAEATDIYPFPSSVSYRILCYYAAARYYEIKGTASSLNKYRYWKEEFEDRLTSLNGGSKMSRRRIKATYNFGDFQ